MSKPTQDPPLSPAAAHRCQRHWSASVSWKEEIQQWLHHPRSLFFICNEQAEDAYTWAWVAAPGGSVTASVPQDATLAWTQLLAHTRPGGQGASKPKTKSSRKWALIQALICSYTYVYMSVFFLKSAPFTRALLSWAFLECNHTVYPHSGARIQIVGGTHWNILRLAAWQFLLSFQGGR